jgi:NAD(P)-dependent dehydrogenase (short-subunit alcohol dehydrogenase family)
MTDFRHKRPFRQQQHARNQHGFTHKRVLITGAASGIGLCTAKEFAKAGGQLIITDINAEGLANAQRELSVYGVEVASRVVDVTQRDRVEDLADWVIHTLGGLDVLINNAGIGYQGELADTSIETWSRLLGVNLLGPLYHVYAFLPHFKQKRSGHIVNISSGQAYFRLPTWGAYASIKAALGIVSEILHYELRSQNIKVTTVYPFMVNTPFYDDIQAETWGSRLAMKLIPFYSMRPERVGRIIFKAVKRQARVERVSRLNDLGLYARSFPYAGDLIAMTSTLLLGGKMQTTD